VDVRCSTRSNRFFIAQNKVSEPWVHNLLLIIGYIYNNNAAAATWYVALERHRQCYFSLSIYVGACVQLDTAQTNERTYVTVSLSIFFFKCIKIAATMALFQHSFSFLLLFEGHSSRQQELLAADRETNFWRIEFVICSS
jgi:hypothetical protein